MLNLDDVVQVHRWIYTEWTLLLGGIGVFFFNTIMKILSKKYI